MGLGVALNGPAWQAVISELVPRAELPAAVAPQLGRLQHRARRRSGARRARRRGAGPGADVPPERASVSRYRLRALRLAARARRARRSPPSASSAPCAAACVTYATPRAPRRDGALRRLHVLRDRAHGAAAADRAPRARRGPTGYGVLLGCARARCRHGRRDARPSCAARVSPSSSTRLGSVVFALCCLVVAQRPRLSRSSCAAMWIAGICWLTAAVDLLRRGAGRRRRVGARAAASPSTSSSSPAGMAVGSAVWGALAARVGTPWALSSAALGLRRARCRS